MATEQFHDCFIGEKGYENLKKLMRSGNEVFTDVAKCFQERSDAELLYVRALRKNSDALQKLAGRTKGTLAQALTTLANQTDKESEAHNDIATVLSSDIAIPMKNRAEAQIKERKGIEDALNAKFKEWNAQKDIDYKYRARQFDISKEIEVLHLKITALPPASKHFSKESAKESILSSPLVVGCVMPRGRHTSASQKFNSTPDVKYQMNISANIQKAVEDLEKTEIKYHLSTKNVELARQACAAEMRRACDQFQDIEFSRISEMGKFFQAFSTSIEALSNTMSEISVELNNTKIVPENDIVVQARSNVQPAEIEILLYDIYAENVGGSSPMSDLSRIESLQKWMDMLKKDLQQQPRSYTTASRTTTKKKTSNGDDDDDSSSDGAMHSTSSRSKKNVRREDDSSDSSNDDDGAMCRKKEKKRRPKGGVQPMSSDVFVDRQSTDLFQELYRASLFNIETIYNRLKNLREPRYEYEQCLAKTINDKGSPTSFLRLPVPSPAMHTPPSAPLVVKHFVNNIPLNGQPGSQQAPPQFGWVMPEGPSERIASVPTAPAQHFIFPTVKDSRTRMVSATLSSAAPPYPPAMPQSTDFIPQKKDKHVRVIHSYQAQHRDELTLIPDDVLMLLEKRDDGWCKGNLNNKIGLFPGNHVEDISF